MTDTQDDLTQRPSTRRPGGTERPGGITAGDIVGRSRASTPARSR